MLKFFAKHMLICHPEVLATADDQHSDSETKKRGRKTTKQRIRELVREINEPLGEIKCSIQFSIPNDYA